MVRQLSIFDIESDIDINNEIEMFDIGDIVKAINKADPNKDPESYFYIKPLENKEGKIARVIEKPKLHYLVEFRDVERYFYHDELKLVKKGGV
jgi:hypothetical protein